MIAIFIISILILIPTVLNAQITVNMSIEYQKNTDTILKDSLVPMLCIEFKNETDMAQYFVLQNTEQYPYFEMGGVAYCFGTPEDKNKFWNDFHYFVCNDMHYVYLKNSTIEISHDDFRKYKSEEIEIVPDLTASEFSLAYDYIRKHRILYSNKSSQIVLLGVKQSYYVVYDLTMFSLIGGEYEFIFEIKPPDNSFPDMIAQYQKCKEFIVKETLKFKP